MLGPSSVAKEEGSLSGVGITGCKELVRLPEVSSRSKLSESFNNLDFHGRFARYPNFSVRAGPDPYFSLFCDFPDDYRMAAISYQASVNGVSKYDYPTITVEPLMLETMKHVTHYVRDQLYVNGVHSCLVSLEESIDELVPSTSPGFPWTQLSSTKSLLLESGFAQHICERYFNELIHLDTPTTYWSSALKEEVQKTAKVKMENTRQINAAPMEHICAMNVYCLEFNRAFYANALHLPNAVGLSPFYRGWDAAYSKIAVFARGMSVDVKNYDAHMPAVLLWQVRQLRKSLAVGWVEDDFIRFDKLYDDVVHTMLVLPSGEVFRKHLGNPSGCSNTIVDNTLVLWIVVYWSLFHFGNYSLEFIEDNFRFLFGGDDNTFTFSDIVDEEKVKLSMTQGFSYFGWELKGLEAKPLEQLDFFSNSFVDYGGFKVPKSVRPVKLIASLAYKYRGGGPVETLSRAAAIRVLLRFDAYWFAVLSDFISYLVDVHNPFLHECKEWRDAKRLILTVDQLDDLYLGSEV